MEEKKQVNFKDMDLIKKYIKDFNSKDYITVTGNRTDPYVLNLVQDYCDRNLPLDMTFWYRYNGLEQDIYDNEEFITKVQFDNAISFITDELCALLFESKDEFNAHMPQVISSYVDEFLKLPVILIKSEKYQLEVILNWNIYTWNVSIVSSNPLDVFENIDHIMRFLNRTVAFENCPNFPKDYIFENYKSNHSKFSFEVNSSYKLYLFFVIAIDYLKKLI